MEGRTFRRVFLGTAFAVFPIPGPFFRCRVQAYSRRNGTIRRYFGVTGRIFAVARTHLPVLHLLQYILGPFTAYLPLPAIFHLEKLCFYLL